MQQEGVGVVELARRIDVTTKSVTEALRWCAPGTIGMLAALGRDRAIRPRLAAADPDRPLALRPALGVVEPDMLTRLRLLGYAHEQGLVWWGSPTEVNRAGNARAFGVAVGDQDLEVDAEAVPAFLVGVADALDADVAERMYQLGACSC